MRGIRLVSGIRRLRYSGFTLVELLLVAAIIAIVAAVVVPAMGRSMRGQRLRIAGRTAVMVGRYARTMAILRQQDLILRIDLSGATVSVAQNDKPVTSNEQALEEDVEQKTGVGFEVSGTESGSSLLEGQATYALPAGGASVAELSRRLEGVVVRQVEFLDESSERHTDGVVSVPYRCNGTCRPHRIELADDRGDTVLVEIDALGGARMEKRR